MRRKLFTTLAGMAVALALSAGGPIGCAPTSGGGSSCCRVCTTGKACGDSCIASHLTCHQGGGCACNGSLEADDVVIASGRGGAVVPPGTVAAAR